MIFLHVTNITDFPLGDPDCQLTTVFSSTTISAAQSITNLVRSKFRDWDLFRVYHSIVSTLKAYSNRHEEARLAVRVLHTI